MSLPTHLIILYVLSEHTIMLTMHKITSTCILTHRCACLQIQLLVIPPWEGRHSCSLIRHVDKEGLGIVA